MSDVKITEHESHMEQALTAMRQRAEQARAKVQSVTDEVLAQQQAQLRMIAQARASVPSKPRR